MGSIRSSIELQDNFTSIMMNMISVVNTSVSAISQMQSVMNEPIDTAAIQGMRGQFDQAVIAAQDLNDTMRNLESSAAVSEMEQRVAEITNKLNGVARMQDAINTAGQNLYILPEDTVKDIKGINVEIERMQQALNFLEATPFNLDSDIAELQIKAISDSINEIAEKQQQIGTLMDNVPSQIIEVGVNPVLPEEVAIPVQWQTDNLEVFTNTGMERFEMEVQSANSMLDALNQTQAEIAARAAQTNIFPSGMVTDMNWIQERMQAIQSRMQAIESNPLNMGTDAASAEVERMRSQFDQMAQAQQNLSRAVDDMDVQAANEAYLRLSQIIGGTERHIRDNVDEQGRFNREIQEGAQQANDLLNTIMGAVGAYMSIQSVRMVLEVSDELVQTTSRLDMMNDGEQSTQELVNMVYVAAQDARGSFGEMADVVARFGNNARDAFSSSEEVVAFAGLIQKQMTIAGASTQEASNAMLQLSQALGSGVLRGDELNSIFEQAPNLIQNIADYLEVPIGQIREMASAGELSADVVKAAIFSASDEINEKFESMPMTWGQVWQSMQNTAMIAFQPVLQRLNEIANSEAFQGLINNAIEVLSMVAGISLEILDLLVGVAGVVADNWSWLSPIIYGVIGALAVYGTYLAITKGLELASAAAKGIMAVWEGIHAAAIWATTGATWAEVTAQNGLNAAMYACPIVWIIILIIALIALFYAAVVAINKFAGTSVSATGIICGVFMVAAAFIGNLFVTLINFVIDIFAVLWNFIAAFVNFFGNVFTDPVGAIARLLFDLAECILGLLESVASAIDTIFGSNLAGTIAGWRDSLDGWVDEKFGQGEEIMAKMDASSLHLERFEYGAAWDAGYAFGEGIDESIANFDPSSLFGTTDIPSADDYASALTAGGIGRGVDDIVGNTGAMADAMDITGEELKYLRDIAEQESVNRFTTADIYIDQSGMQNTIKNGMDLDGMISSMTDAVTEAIDISTEGVHV